MPITDPMTWCKDSSKRWVKRVRGMKAFYFVPAKHGVEPTKDGSRAAMRAWWAIQEANLNKDANEANKAAARQFLATLAGPAADASESQIAMAILGSTTHVATARGLALLAVGAPTPTPALTEADANARMQLVDSQPEVRKNMLDVAQGIIDNLTVQGEDGNWNSYRPEVVDTQVDATFGAGMASELRQRRDEAIATLHTPTLSPTPATNLIRHQIDRWLVVQESRVKTGSLEPGSLRGYRSSIGALRELCFDHTLDAIDSAWVQDRFHELSNTQLSPTTKCNRWVVWFTFLDSLDTDGLIQIPKNVRKLAKSFPREAKTKKPVWTADEFQTALAEASGVKRLVLLLAANCAFYGSDMAQAARHYNQPKQPEGTIVMARVKTKKKTQPSTYYLWDETRAAMDLHASELIYQQIRRMKFPRSIKNLRHTTQSFLHNSNFAQYKEYMVGLKAVGISNIWYSHEFQENIKAGFEFLRACYRFAATPAGATSEGA
jgi:hypothetical protein